MKYPDITTSEFLLLYSVTLVTGVALAAVVALPGLPSFPAVWRLAVVAGSCLLLAVVYVVVRRRVLARLRRDLQLVAEELGADVMVSLGWMAVKFRVVRGGRRYDGEISSGKYDIGVVVHFTTTRVREMFYVVTATHSIFGPWEPYVAKNLQLACRPVAAPALLGKYTAFGLSERFMSTLLASESLRSELLDYDEALVVVVCDEGRCEVRVADKRSGVVNAFERAIRAAVVLGDELGAMASARVE